MLKDLELVTVSFSSIKTRVKALRTFDGELRKIALRNRGIKRDRPDIQPKDSSKSFSLSDLTFFCLNFWQVTFTANSFAEFSALSSVSSSSDNEHAQNVESTQGKNPSPNVSTQKTTDEKSSLRKQLEEKQKELEAAQKMVQNMTKREKDLMDR